MIKQEYQEKLNAYAKLKLQLRDLEAQIEELNPMVTAIIEASGADEIEVGDLGKLVRGVRRVWKYSSAIEELKTKYDAERKKAEQTGVGATYSERPYVIFKSKQESNEN